nr:hypothetical protein [Acidobacteriota bacterium]
MSFRPELIRIAGITLRVRYAEASRRRPLSKTVSRFAVDADDDDVDVDIVIELMTDALAAPGRMLFD